MKTVLPALAILLLSGPVMADECMDCHRDPDFRVTHPKLYDYFQEFDASVHGVAGLTCADCHGGDTTTTDMEKAHEGVLEPVRYDRIPDTCGNCHVEQRQAFITSDHYKKLLGKGIAPNCATCHGAMEMDFIFVTRVKSTCLFCHNEETGIHPGVPAEADYVLNKINVIKGYRSYVNAHLADNDRKAELNRRYDELTARWHRFDLQDAEQITQALLGDYRKAKKQALRDRKERKTED